MSSPFEIVIGLEVHAQLSTATKAFCGCSTHFGDLPNRNTCPVCLGLPGALPVLNRQAVELALRLAVALGCEVRAVSEFARKNYFYPDLPKGYQITQYDLPLAEHGTLAVPWEEGHEKRVRIKRVHLEEDAGRSVHVEGGRESLVDFNRCGIPLAEIVTEPDLSSPAEAAAFLRELRDVVRFLRVCDGNLEAGSFRCDANLSIRAAGSAVLGTRTELKNLNSFRHVQAALEHEAARQAAVVAGGGCVEQETRLWDERRGETRPLRGKEEAHDYRYFPDPDLLPLAVSQAWVERVRGELPVLPAGWRAALSAHGLPWYDVQVLTAEQDLAAYAADCLGRAASPKVASNFIMTEMLSVLREKRWRASEFPVSPADVAKLADLLDGQKLSQPMAKAAFLRMWQERLPAEEVLAAVGEQLSDEAALSRVCRQIVEASPEEVGRYLGGRTALLSWFVGQAMNATRGRGNPRLLSRLFASLLEGKRKS